MHLFKRNDDGQRRAAGELEDRRIKAVEIALPGHREAVLHRKAPIQVWSHRRQIVQREVPRVHPSLRGAKDPAKVGNADNEHSPGPDERKVSCERLHRIVEVLDESKREHEIRRARLDCEEVAVHYFPFDTSFCEVATSQGRPELGVFDTCRPSTEALGVEEKPFAGCATDLQHVCPGSYRRVSGKRLREDALERHRRIGATRKLGTAQVFLLPEELIGEVGGRGFHEGRNREASASKSVIAAS